MKQLPLNSENTMDRAHAAINVTKEPASVVNAQDFPGRGFMAI